jgi:hypothetical protein
LTRKTYQAPTTRAAAPSLGLGASSTGTLFIPSEKDVQIMNKTFDISNLAVNPTSIVKLESPDGDSLKGEDGEAISITVYGPGSKQFQKAQSTRNRALLEYVRKGGKKVKDEEQREMDADFLAACTVSFNNFVYKDLSGIEMFRAAYMDTSIGFISEQVNKAISDWSNFTKTPSTI